MKRCLLILLVFHTFATTHSQQLPMQLWYDSPATWFEEAMPLGNGALGAMVYGNPDRNVIHLNDITFWSGKPVDLHADKDAYRWIPKIREALFNEDYKTADSLQHFVQGSNSQYYRPLGTLYIQDLNRGETPDYHRYLSLDSAICHDRYTRNGIVFAREYFVSHADRVIAIRLTASKAGAINCHFTLNSQVNHRIDVSDKQIVMRGHADKDPETSIPSYTLLQAKNTDGTWEKTDSGLVIKGATEAVVYIFNRTGFKGYDRKPEHEDGSHVAAVLDDARCVGNYAFDSLRTRHVSNYRTIFDRVKFYLGGSRFNHHKPTDRLLKDYGKDRSDDLFLESLYFQYGRYLLISCSRTPGVPANLQGLWNDKMYAPWRGNYTININLEENYWPCDVANMPEMFAPLAGFAQNLAATGRHTAQNYYGIGRGWCSGHNSDIWAMTNPVGEKNESPTWSNWNMGGAWLMQNIYDHYLYTMDTHYLRTVAYPLMKGASDFMLDWLVPNPHNPGTLFTAPSTSPEAYYINTDNYKGATLYGATADLAIIRELFTNTLEAAKVLGKDKNYCDTLRQTIARLHPYTIGKEGDINEWYHDWQDEDVYHRHQSHLIGLYPGHQISPEHTPKLTQAAAKSLLMKGERTTGWSTGWRINLWARLHNGQQAYRIYRKLLNYVTPAPGRGKSGGTYPNLFDAHPPFQIDGNFGGTAGVCEMLMQSHGGTIHLLPALPEEWGEGEIRGLKARGGFEVSLKWKDHKVVWARITSTTGGKVHVKYNGTTARFNIKKGKTITIE